MNVSLDIIHVAFIYNGETLCSSLESLLCPLPELSLSWEVLSVRQAQIADKMTLKINVI